MPNIFMEGNNLKKIQKKELSMLKTFDKFCRKRDIKYSLAFGTLLGAVRHKGFIPWDDDIDLIMTKEEYKKLISLLDFFPDKIKIKFGLDSEPEESMGLVAKIFQKLDKDNKESSPFIDIFVFKKISSHMLIQFLERFIHFLIRYFGALQNDKTIFKSFSSKSRNILLKIIYLPRLILNKLDFYNKIKLASDKFLNNPTQKSFYLYWSGFLILNSNEIYPLKKLKFEDSFFPVIKNYNKFLKVMYGNYMKLPPVENRIPHH